MDGESKDFLRCYLQASTKETIMFELTLVEKIKKMFIDDSESNLILVDGECHICGEKTIIEIAKTSGGFGINGGMLQEIHQNQLNIFCIDCYLNSKSTPIFLKTNSKPENDF